MGSGLPRRKGLMYPVGLEIGFGKAAVNTYLHT